MRILIADDEEEFVQLLKERLEGFGHQVDGVYDGGDARDAMESGDYDLVFVDHDMPSLSGLELAKFAKAAKLRAKVIMVTGYEAMSGEFAKTVGVDEYLTKPVKIKDLDEIIGRYGNGMAAE